MSINGELRGIATVENGTFSYVRALVVGDTVQVNNRISTTSEFIASDIMTAK